MRTRSTFSINFWINTSRMIHGKAKIYARITIDSKRANMSLKYTIDKELWDKKLSRAKGKTPESNEINGYLQEVQARLFECYRDLKLTNDHTSAEMVKARYLGEDVVHKSLVELFKYHNLHSQKLLSKATLRHYHTTQKYLLGYLRKVYDKNDIQLTKLDHFFYSRFRNLSEEPCPQTLSR